MDCTMTLLKRFPAWPCGGQLEGGSVRIGSVVYYKLVQFVRTSGTLYLIPSYVNRKFVTST